MPKENKLGDYMIYISTKKIKRKDKIYESWRINIQFWNKKTNKLKIWHDSTYSKKKYTLEDVVKIRDKIIRDNDIDMSRNSSPDLLAYNFLNGTNLKKLPTNSEQEQELRDYFYNRNK